MRDYAKENVGEKTVKDGETFFTADAYARYGNYGHIYKNYAAFYEPDKYPEDEIVYIAEFGLENEIDTMPLDAKHRERKLHDMTLRLDGLYETMIELEETIEDAKLRKQGIEMESISLENIYEILRTFEEIYDIMDDKEQKTLITYLIKEIQINPHNQENSVMPLKSIEFNFPLYKGGKEVRKIFWETQSSVETLNLLSFYFKTKKCTPIT